MKQLTAEQVYKKYKGKYIRVYRTMDYTKHVYVYEVQKCYKSIHENTVLCDSLDFYDN